MTIRGHILRALLFRALPAIALAIITAIGILLLIEAAVLSSHNIL